jgi:hypothetical protein
MYGTVEDWRTYATARGDESPSNVTTTVAQAALVRASDYIETVYVQHFTGSYDGSLVAVEYATYEAAKLELATPGFFNKTFTPDQQKVLTEAKGIKWTPVGDASGADAARPISTSVEARIGHMVGRDKGFGIRSIGG